MPAATLIPIKTFRPYRGAANVRARRYGATDATFISMGSVAEVVINQAVERQTIPQHMPGGGTHASTSRAGETSLTMSCYDWSEENMNIAMWGDTTLVSGSTVTDESHTAQPGRLIALAHIDPTDVVVTSDPSGTTYTEGTDYLVFPEGIEILTTGSISADAALLISYAYSEYRSIQPLTQQAVELELLIGGVNEADTSDVKPAVLSIWRVQVDAASQIPFTATDFQPLPFNAMLLPKPGVSAGESPYYLHKYK